MMNPRLIPPPDHVHDFRPEAFAHSRLLNRTFVFVRCEECGATKHSLNDVPRRCMNCQRCLVDTTVDYIYCPQCAPFSKERDAAVAKSLYGKSEAAWHELRARVGRRFFMLFDRQPELIQMEFQL